VVEPDGNTINMTTPDGSVITSKVNYVKVTDRKSFAQAISKVQATSVGSANDGYIVELGERLYDGKLKLNEEGLDVFGRPARKWEFDGKAIGSYAKKELMEKNDVGKVTGVDLYNLLGASTIKDYDLTVTVDGISDPDVYDAITNARKDGSNTSVVFNATDLNRNNKAAIGGTGTGVLMQVFVDHESDNIYVAVINTYLAIADKGYDEKKEEASIEVFDLDKDLTKDEYAKTAQNPATKQSEKFKLGVEDFNLVKDIEKNDPFLVTVADGAIQTITPAEVLSGVTISAFKKFDHVVSGGTKYAYTTTAGYKHEDLSIYTGEAISNLKEITYNIYLDAYGNLIGIEEVDAAKNYVFLSSIDRNGSYTTNTTATANAVFLDGTSGTISINMAKSVWRPNRSDGLGGATTNFGAGNAMLNTWCTYTKSGDVYTVREVWNVTDPSDGLVNRADNRFPKAVANSASTVANGTDLAQYHDTSVSEVTLKNGLRLPGGYAVTEAFYSAYGDSSSVYLTADLGTLEYGGKYGVIKGAETVHTGIDGTSISVWTGDDARREANKDRNNIDLDLDNGVPGAGDDVSEGIYTLYNDEGIVIASMVVGEGSSAKDLVYVHSGGLDLEEDNGGNTKATGDGLWTWYRKVIRNGEEVTLTEVGDAAEELISMQKYQWYQVKTDGNGNVTKVIPAWEALDNYTVTPNNNRSVFLTDYTKINAAVANTATDTVLYQTDGGPVDYAGDPGAYTHTGFDATRDLEIKGTNLLAVTNTEGAGIYCRNDVHVVLQYWNRNVDGIDIMVGEGLDDLKDFVDFVNANNDAAIARNGNRLASENYYVSALIQNGAATDIVIYDNFNGYSRPEVDGKDQSLTLAGKLGTTWGSVNDSSVYTVDANGRLVFVKPNNDWSTGWGGFKEYTIKSGTTVRVYDADITGTYVPYFSPELDVLPVVNYGQNYVEFVMPRNAVTVRDMLPGDVTLLSNVNLTLKKALDPNLTRNDVTGTATTNGRAVSSVPLTITDVTVSVDGGQLEANIDWTLPAGIAYDLASTVSVKVTDVKGVTSNLGTVSVDNVDVPANKVASADVVTATVDGSTGNVTIATLNPAEIGEYGFVIYDGADFIGEGTVSGNTASIKFDTAPAGTVTVNGDTVTVDANGNASVTVEPTPPVTGDKATVTAAAVDGATVTFDPAADQDGKVTAGVVEVKINVTDNTKEIAKVEVKEAQDAQAQEITANQGKYTFTAVKDKVYTVTVTLKAKDVVTDTATVTAAAVDGATVTFDPAADQSDKVAAGEVEVKINVTDNTKKIAKVEVKEAQDNQAQEITANQGKYTFTAVKDKVYTVTVTLEAKSSDATLSSLSYSVAGGQATPVANFAAATESYSVELAQGTDASAVITLTGVVTDTGKATITTNEGVTLSNGTGTATILVTAEDGTTKTYTIEFTTAS